MESLREIFFKQTGYIHSKFDVGRSMLDVHKFFFRSNWPFCWPEAALNVEPGTCERLPTWN